MLWLKGICIRYIVEKYMENNYLYFCEVINKIGFKGFDFK